MRKHMVDLMLFCDPDVTSMSTPWSEGDYTYATDRKIIVRVLRRPNVLERADAMKITGSKTEDSLNGVHNIRSWFAVPAVENDLVPCKACGGSGRPDVCPECHGDGTVSLSNRFNEYEHECKTCEGAGKFTGKEDPNKVPLCGKCDDDGKVLSGKTIDIGCARFSVNLLSRICGLPNVKIAVPGEDVAAKFAFDGGDGLIMPMRKD